MSQQAHNPGPLEVRAYETFGWCIRRSCKVIGPLVLGNGYCVDCWDTMCGEDLPEMPKKEQFRVNEPNSLTPASG